MTNLGPDIYKLVAIAVIISAALLGAKAAGHLTGSTSSSRRTGSANAMAGGFLLGAGLFHFLPDAHRLFEVVYPNNVIPIGFAICAAGFTAVLAIERMFFDPTAHAVEAGSSRNAPVLAIVLSVHALLAGFAVGSEKAPLALFGLVVALAVHKFAAAFTLGSGLIRGGVSVATFRKTIGAFALATPLGMVLGTVFQRFVSDDAGLLTEATFDALAAGSFLYIAALDVVHDEFYHKRASWLDMVLFVAGLAVMLLLSLVE